MTMTAERAQKLMGLLTIKNTTSVRLAKPTEHFKAGKMVYFKPVDNTYDWLFEVTDGVYTDRVTLDYLQASTFCNHRTVTPTNEAWF